jgi:hypothetical protein
MRNATIDTHLDLSVTDIIWLGERADSKRGVDLVLVRDKDGKPNLRETPEPGDEVVQEITIRTPDPSGQPGFTREQIAEVICRSAEGKEFTLLSSKEFDAVFWSESSVRKFVWPYYHSHRLWDAELQTLQDQFDGDPTAVAIAHQAPSKSSVQKTSSVSNLLVAKVAANKAAPELKFMPAAHYCAR